MATVVAGIGYVIGSYMPMQVFKITPSAAEDTATTLTVDLSRYFKTILGIVSICIIDTNGKVDTQDVAVSISGTSVTIADGSSYDLTSTDTIYLTVYGTPVA